MSLKEGLAPIINLTKLPYRETQSHSTNTKEDINSVTICWTYLRKMQIASKQLYDSSMPLYGPLGTNEKTKLPLKYTLMDSEHFMKIWTRVNGATTENVWLDTELS